jgi:hypothetical protein
MTSKTDFVTKEVLQMMQIPRSHCIIHERNNCCVFFGCPELSLWTFRKLGLSANFWSGYFRTRRLGNWPFD